MFSEPVLISAATNVSNYSINNGVTISRAVGGAGSNTVVLTTSSVPLGPNYVLSVSRVQDLFGNAISSNSQIALNVLPDLPLEAGQLVNGFQDDFEGLTRDPHWVPNSLHLPITVPRFVQSLWPMGNGSVKYR